MQKNEGKHKLLSEILYFILSNHQHRQGRPISVLFVCAEVYHGEGIREGFL